MITPSDSPSAPSEYAAVPTSGMDIQAPQEDLSAMSSAAMSAAMARQPEASALLMGPAGMGDFDITSGYTGSWGVVPEPDVAGP